MEPDFTEVIKRMGEPTKSKKKKVDTSTITQFTQNAERDKFITRDFTNFAFVKKLSQFASQVHDLYDELIQKEIEKQKEKVKSQIMETVELVVPYLKAFNETIDKINKFYKMLDYIFIAIIVLEGAVIAWKNNFVSSAESFTGESLNWISEKMEKVKSFYHSHVEPKIETFKKQFEKVYNSIKNFGKSVWDVVKEYGAKGLKILIESSKVVLVKLFDGVKQAIVEMISKSKKERDNQKAAQEASLELTQEGEDNELRTALGDSYVSVLDKNTTGIIFSNYSEDIEYYQEMTGKPLPPSETRERNLQMIDNQMSIFHETNLEVTEMTVEDMKKRINAMQKACASTYEKIRVFNPNATGYTKMFEDDLNQLDQMYGNSRSSQYFYTMMEKYLNLYYDLKIKLMNIKQLGDSVDDVELRDYRREDYYDKHINDFLSGSYDVLSEVENMTKQFFSINLEFSSIGKVLNDFASDAIKSLSEVFDSLGQNATVRFFLNYDPIKRQKIMSESQKEETSSSVNDSTSIINFGNWNFDIKNSVMNMSSAEDEEMRLRDDQSKLINGIFDLMTANLNSL